MTTIRKLDPDESATDFDAIIASIRADEVFRRLVAIDAVESATRERAAWDRDFAIKREFEELAESLGFRVVKIEPVKEAAE